MAVVFIDRLLETTTTVGTGPVSLAGAVTGYNTFASRLSNGDSICYCIQGGSQFEVGVGTYDAAGNAVNRAVAPLQSSSPANAVVSFSAGTKNVFLTYAGAMMADLRPPGAGSILVVNAGNTAWVGVVMSGDATMTSAGVITVTKINGVALSGAAPAVGNGLNATGAAAMQWGPLNLAGGAGYVTGLLPVANQAAQTPTMGGVIGGTTAATVFNLGSQSILLKRPALMLLAQGLSATNIAGWGGATTNTGTLTGRAIATTNMSTRIKRVGYVSAAGAGSLSGVRITDLEFTAGSGTPGDGSGFYMVYRWIESDAAAVAGRRAFVGLTDQTGVPTNVDPGTLTNAIGVGQLSSDATQWYWIHGGSVAQATVAITGSGAPGFNNPPNVFELIIYAPSAEANKFYLTLTNLRTGATSSTSFTGAATIVPQSTTFLSFRMWATNNATALAVAQDFNVLVAEYDF